MRKKLIYIQIGIIGFTFSIVGLLFYKKAQETPAHPKKAIIKNETVKKVPVRDNVPQKPQKELSEPATKHPTQPLKKVLIKSHNIALTQVTFDDLPGWDDANVQKSFTAFRTSCETFLKNAPSHPIGSQHIKLKAGDWYPACKAALELNEVTEESAKVFFEHWFHPIKFEQKKTAKNGLFTGYYMPQLKGNLTQNAHYNTPIYGLPKSGAGIHYTREQIDNGILKKKAPVIAWIHSPAERLFLEIEGSGVVQLPDGKNIYLGYAGENGKPYTSISKVMISKGIMTRHNASKKAIIKYLEQHPAQAKEIIHKNKSFVFFEHVKKPVAIGTKGVALTPGYSLAVDTKWIPFGAPLWLNTTRPDSKKNNEKQLQRLMIAQDTGGAIRGFMRGDIYWGSGKLATFLGEHMKNEGSYWLLLPKHIFSRLANRAM